MCCMFLIPKGYLFLQADNLLIAVLTLFKDCVFYWYSLIFLHKNDDALFILHYLLQYRLHQPINHLSHLFKIQRL